MIFGGSAPAVDLFVERFGLAAFKVGGDLAPVSPDGQAVAVWAAMNSRGERMFSPECGWLSL